MATKNKKQSELRKPKRSLPKTSAFIEDSLKPTRSFKEAAEFGLEFATPGGVIAKGLSKFDKVGAAAKRVNEIRRKMKQVQGKPASTVKGAVNKELRRSPEKVEKLSTMADKLRRTSQAAGKESSGKVLNKANQLQRKTAEGKRLNAKSKKK